jgi:AraC-like DNA-binding protein
MHVVRQLPSPQLRPYLLTALEGWTQTRGSQTKLREVPFPGVPLIFGLGGSWLIEGPEARQPECHESFVSGLHAAPALVQPADSSWSCIELRLTPVAAHRILGLPMHELTNRSVALEHLVRGADELSERLRDTESWSERFALVESFLFQRLDESEAPAREVEWSWHELRRTAGQAPIGGLAGELGWSHRRLIARFREQIGLAPKAVARVMRFDRAVQALRAPTRGLAEIAYDCGYFDQAHLNRDFRALAGTTPSAFRTSTLDSGGLAA